MNFFSQNKNAGSKDVKFIRDEILYAIRQQLSAFEGGEGGKVRSVCIYIACPETERTAYESAVYYGEGDKFKRTEVNRIVEDYNIQLPTDWKLEINFSDSIPSEATTLETVDAGIHVSTSKQAKISSGKALLVVLQGEAEKERMELNAGRTNIGRDKKTKTSDGFLRENDVCFPSASSNEANKFVSSRHAHIEFDQAMGKYLLYADEGGVPPNNKLKVKRRNDDVAVKLQSTNVPHALEDGDRIILGDSVMLEFKLEQS